MSENKTPISATPAQRRFDRDRQRSILERAMAGYPDMIEFEETDGGTANTCPLVGELTYLKEHGLIQLEMPQYIDTTYGAAEVKITAKGIDFLADDGGLGAILGTVTVKLHSDTVRDLLIARVRESDEPDTVKTRLIDQLKATPAVALGQLTERALDAGLQAMPRFAEWLQGQF